MTDRLRLITGLCTSFIMTAAAFGQMETPNFIEVDIQLDSGYVENSAGERAVIFSDVVAIPDMVWLRLLFDTAELGSAPPGGEPTVLRISSVRDGAAQHLNAAHLRQWRNTTACLNGQALIVEIIADPGAEPSRVAASRAMAQPVNPGGQDTICGNIDDRELSIDPRVARLAPRGCTTWMIDDANHCFLTAGHCDGNIDLVWFNMPLSDANGNVQAPPPEDQYAHDPVSVQSNGGQGVGDDWAYFGCFANPETGLTPFQAQGDFFVLSKTPPAVDGQFIRITGHGTVSGSVPREWNQVQKTHAGPYVAFFGTTVRYAADTTGGNSGSPVINEETGEAIGIHTHGGCNNTGANHGTGSNHAGLRNALANPRGVCIPPFDRGDLNCDGEINAFDIEPFLLALFDPENYLKRFPDCDINLADVNADGSINAFDIEPFLEVLSP